MAASEGMRFILPVHDRVAASLLGLTSPDGGSVVRSPGEEDATCVGRPAWQC